MKQPYTYSMPESFLKDKNVPARWRVLAVINGFILNGGCFYGSNEWLMEQLSCSEQTVSNAFEELENLGEIRTERTRRTRKVYKTSRDPSQLGSETQVGSPRDPSSFGTNSVSNSVSNIGVATAPLIVVSEEEEKPPKGKNYTKGYDTLCNWMENLTGVRFVDRRGQYTALKKAREADISPTRLKSRAEELWPKLEAKGMDWFDVVYSFNKRA